MAIQTLKFRAKRESMLEKEALEKLAGKMDSFFDEVKCDLTNTRLIHEPQVEVNFLVNVHFSLIFSGA